VLFFAGKTEIKGYTELSFVLHVLYNFKLMNTEKSSGKMIKSILSMEYYRSPSFNVFERNMKAVFIMR
jgi:hypothetical protein